MARAREMGIARGKTRVYPHPVRDTASTAYDTRVVAQTIHCKATAIPAHPPSARGEYVRRAGATRGVVELKKKKSL